MIIDSYRFGKLSVVSSRVVALPAVVGRYHAELYGSQVLTIGSPENGPGEYQVAWDLTDTTTDITTSHAFRIPTQGGIVGWGQIGDRFYFPLRVYGECLWFDASSGAMGVFDIPTGYYFSIGVAGDLLICPQSGANNLVVIDTAAETYTAGSVSGLNVTDQWYQGVQVGGEMWFPERRLGKMLAVDVSTGAGRVITLSVPGTHSVASAVAVGSEVWVPNSYGTIYVFDTGTETITSNFSVPTGGAYSAIKVGTNLYLPNSSAPSCTVVNTTTKAYTTIAMPDRASYDAVYEGGDIVVPQLSGTNTYRINTSTHAVSTVTSSGVSMNAWAVGASGDKAWIWSSDESKVICRRVDGVTATDLQLPDGPPLTAVTFTVVGDEMVYWLREPAMVLRIDLSTGSLAGITNISAGSIAFYASLRVGDYVLCPVAGTGAHAGKVFRLNLTTGAIDSTTVGTGDWYSGAVYGTQMVWVSRDKILEVNPVTLASSVTTVSALTASQKWGVAIDGSTLYTADDNAGSPGYSYAVDLSTKAVTVGGAMSGSRRITVAQYGHILVWPLLSPHSGVGGASVSKSGLTVADFPSDAGVSPSSSVVVGNEIWCPSSNHASCWVLTIGYTG